MPRPYRQILPRLTGETFRGAFVVPAEVAAQVSEASWIESAKAKLVELGCTAEQAERVFAIAKQRAYRSTRENYAVIRGVMQVFIYRLPREGFAALIQELEATVA